jgi:uncharacterized HAD superfamily protein
VANIIFDIDGVLCDWLTGFTQLAHDYFGSPVQTHSATFPEKWDFHEEIGLTKKQFEFVWEKIKTSEVFWTQLTPLLEPSVFARIDSLTADHALYFVSARPGIYVKQQTEEWLKHQGVYRPTVIISDRKGDIAAGIKADYAIDDKAGNAVMMKYQNPRTNVYILDRPYNRFDHNVLGKDVSRVYSVEDFIKVIENGI